MNHTIQLTAEQFEALQSGQPITIKPSKPTTTKWEPRGGCIQITASLNVTDKWEPTSAGMCYPNINKANSAAKALRSYARQLAWLAENDDGLVADWNDYKQNKYFVGYNHYHQKITRCNSYNTQFINIIFMSEANATKLAQLMNDGIVEF